MHEDLESARSDSAQDAEPQMMHEAAAAQQALRRRFARRSIAVLLLIAAAILSITIISGVPDRHGATHLDEAFQRALVVFGVARALNGVISVAQGTEFAMQPAGVGVTVAPGQILDPINDLIERFSWVMLASAVALGTLSVLLEAGQWMPLTLGAVAALLGSVALVAVPLLRDAGTTQPAETPAPSTSRHRHSGWRRVLFGATIVLLFLRLCVPLVAIGMDMTFETFLSERYQSHAAGLEQATDRLESINRRTSDDAEVSGSLWDQTKHMLANARDSLDMEARIDRYKAAVASTTEDAIQLIIVFLIQTVMLPLLFIAGALWLLRTALAAVSA